jgi:hypothetical protein
MGRVSPFLPGINPVPKSIGTRGALSPQDRKDLIANQDFVCLYAAKLQEERRQERDYDKRSIWILKRVKTSAGEWPYPLAFDAER